MPGNEENEIASWPERPGKRRLVTGGRAVAVVLAAVAMVVVGLVVVGRSDGQGRSTSVVSQSQTAPSAGPVGPSRTLDTGRATSGSAPGAGCGYTNVVPYDRYKGLPNFTPAKAAQPYLAVIYTTQGTIVIRMFTKAAPCTTYSFRFLAERNYFTRTHCHRLVTQGIYVLQCGDPTGTGSGGPGYKFNDENLKGATYPAGEVAMANAGPNTNGSQFFFCDKANPLLAPDYTPFGHVIVGMSVLDKIAAAGDDSQNGPGDGYPHLYVGIERVQIVPYQGSAIPKGY